MHDLTALYFAAIGGQPEIADLLHAQGADVNDAVQGVAPIHGAVLGGSKEMIHWLLERGADPSRRDYQGRSAPEPANATGRTDLTALF